MSTPQGPQDPRIPHQSGAVPPVSQQQAQPGYGYPPAQYPPPVQPYPYEIRPGVPQVPQPYVPNPNEPDWAAMADRQEAEARRSKRLRIVVISVALAVVVGGVGAVLTLTLGGSKDAKADDNALKHPTTAPATPSAGASGGSSPNGSSGNPTPTLQGSDVFAAATLPVNGRTFVRKITSHESPCWKATGGGLGALLDQNHCTQVALATYSSGKDTVTAGVLSFPTAAQASAVSSAFKGQLAPLIGKSGVPDFCDKVACAVTHAAHGRYVYTTIAGPSSGAAGDKDADSIAAGRGIAGYTLSRVLDLP